MTDSAGWASFLDTLESELQAVRRGDTERWRRATSFVAPDLGPVPEELAARAHELLTELQASETEVRAELARTSDQLRELRHLDPRAPRPASTLDERA